MRRLLVGAHPDDIEVMNGFAAEDADEALAVVLTDGRASTVDMVGSRFCPAWA
jgi:LmbE family N-acetylglucosaminyl deacetylase